LRELTREKSGRLEHREKKTGLGKKGVPGKSKTGNSPEETQKEIPLSIPEVTLVESKKREFPQKERLRQNKGVPKQFAVVKVLAGEKAWEPKLRRLQHGDPKD